MQIRVRDIDQSEIFISLFRVFDGCFFLSSLRQNKKNSFEIFELCFTSFGGSMSNWCIEAENESESKQKKLLLKVKTRTQLRYSWTYYARTLTFRIAGSLKNVQRRISLTFLAENLVTTRRAMTN